MITVEGIFDGTRVIFREKIPVNTSYKVIITFVEEIDEVREFAAHSHVLDFWQDQREDLYQDYLQ